MAIIDSNGDGSVYIKSVNGSIKIGAGGADQVSVGAGNVTFTNSVISTGDLAAAGGFVKSYTFYGYRVLQNSYPLMTSSMMHSSSLTAGVGAKFFTRIPLRASGSIVGISLVAEDGVVKSGSLSASVNINDVPVASLLMFTGAIASTTFAKDTYAFNGNSYLTVQLTASNGYYSDLATLSCSFTCIVDVEY
jgi:hypothetical protein